MNCESTSRPASNGPLSWWLKTATQPPLAPFVGTEEYDVLVLGGGLAGMSCLDALLDGGVAPRRLGLWEASTISYRASGRNAGFILGDLAEPYSRLREALGERAPYLRHLAHANRDRMVANGLRHGFAWGFEPCGSLMAAASEAEEAELLASATALRADGFEVETLDGTSMASRLGVAENLGGYFDPADGAGHPAAYVCGLAAACQERGANLHDRTEATSIEQLDDGRVRVDCARGTATAERVVVALNAYAPLLDPSLEPMVAPFRGQMLSFPPTGPRALKSVVYRNHGFEYFHQRSDGRFLFGGFRQTAASMETGYEQTLNADVQDRLEQFARRMYPQLEEVEPDARWAGTMGFSCDGLPFVGAHPHRPGVMLLLGFTGHGFGLAAECARIAAELLLEGSSADAALFSPKRLL